jgi:hypothetical protein
VLWSLGNLSATKYAESFELYISEIYQVTGPVERFAGQIASQGYVVGATHYFIYYTTNEFLLTILSSACPSVYHEFEGPEPIPYDTEGYFILLLFDIFIIKKTFFQEPIEGTTTRSLNIPDFSFNE